MTAFNQKKLNHLNVLLERATRINNTYLIDKLNQHIDEQKINRSNFLLGCNIFQLFCEHGVKWRGWE